MSLKVYRGRQFEHTHENLIFNELMDLLDVHCSTKSECWYLLGNFFVGSREIDALIIKSNAIIVIDFKDYSGKLVYSQEGPWRIGDVEVRGGASVNPLVQISINRQTLSNFFKKNYSTINCDWNHIAATVVFHNEIDFDQSDLKPPVNRWFYISDIKRIIRVLDSIVSHKINLTPDVMLNIVSYLGIDQYSPDDAVKTRNLIKGIVSEEQSDLDLIRKQRQVLHDFIKWLDKGTDVFRMAGMVSTGKRTLLPYLIRAIKNKKLKPIILTPNARRALEYQYLNAEVISTYTWLYTLKPTHFEKIEGRKRAVYGVKNEIDLTGAVPLFIEAQLFSDEEFKISDIRYGSGHLISDLLTLLKSKKQPFLVLGDPYQLVKGSVQRSLLIGPKLTEEGFKVLECILDEQILMESKDHALSKFQANIVNNLIINRFNSLPNDSGASLVIDAEHSRKWLPDTTNTRAESVLLCGTHKQLSSINGYVKRTILGHGTENNIGPGDRIDFYNRTPILNHNDDIYDEQYISWINSGSIGLVEYVEEGVETFRIDLKGRDKPTLLNFQIATCLIPSLGQVRFRYLVNFVESEKPELESDYYIALQVLARKVSLSELDAYKKELPDKLSRDYDEALKRYEKIEYQILQSRGYLTAALIRLSHAITVHRAQGRSWPKVWINAERSASGDKPNNSEYFRWLYTATTCNIDELIIHNMPRLDPLINSTIARSHDFKITNITAKKVFIYDTNRLPNEQEKSIKKPIGFTDNKLLPIYLEILKRMEKSDWSIIAWQEYNYQVVITFSREKTENSVKIRFHFNKKYAITNIVYVYGAEVDLNDLRVIIDKKFFPESDFMAEAYEFIEEKLFQKGLSVIYGIETNHRIQLTIIKASDLIEVEYNIKKDGMVSSIRILKATSEDIVRYFEEVMCDKS